MNGLSFVAIEKTRWRRLTKISFALSASVLMSLNGSVSEIIPVSYTHLKEMYFYDMEQREIDTYLISLFD